MATFDGEGDREEVKTDEKEQIAGEMEEVTIEKQLTEYAQEVRQLTVSEKDYIEQLVLVDGVNINIHRCSGLIKVVGLSKNIHSVEKMLKTHFQNIHAVKQQAKQAKITAEYVQWNYQPLSGDEICLEEYDKLTNLTLEMAFRNNESEVKLLDPEGVESMVNFNEMMEYIQNDNNDKVKVIRRELKTGNPFENKEVSANKSAEHVEQRQEKSLSKGQFVYVNEAVITQSNDKICSLTEHEVRAIMEVHTHAKIDVDVEQGKIVITGPPRLVLETEERIERKLCHIERQRKLDMEDKLQDVVVNWSYNSEDGTSDTQDYDEVGNATIECAFRSFEDQVQLADSEGIVYIVDFIDMIENMKDNSRDFVRVYRRVKSKGHNEDKKDEKVTESVSNEPTDQGKTVGTVITMTQSTISSLTEQQVVKLQCIHPAANIKVDIGKSEITISGTNRVTNQTATLIRRYLRHIRRKRMLEQESLQSDYLVKWTFSDFDSVSSKVVEERFDEDLSSYIEECYKHMADETILFLPESQTNYIIDFVDMVAYLENDRNIFSTLKRDVYRKTYSIH